MAYMEVASPSAKSAKTVLRRLDALGDAPLSPLEVRMLMLAGVSWTIRSMELVVFTFTRSLVDQDIGMGTSALEILGASISIGAFFGGPVFGYVADKYGRLPSLLLAMALSLVGLGLSAFARRDYEAIIARVIAGVGLGGEIPAATVLIHELAPRTRRGSMVALLGAFSGVGGIVGVVLSYGAAPAVGWRILYGVLTAFVLYAAVLRLNLPESPRWLLSKDKLDEALAVVERIERGQVYGRFSASHDGDEADLDEMIPTPQVLAVILSEATNDADIATSTAACVRKDLTHYYHTLVLWTLWTAMGMSAYTLGSYVPTLVSFVGFNMFVAWSTATLLQVIQIPGCLLASSMLDDQFRTTVAVKLQRWQVDKHKQTLAFFATVAVFAAIAVSYLPWTKPVVAVGTSVVGFAIAGCWSAVFAYTPEHYPVAMRGQGVGSALSFGCVGAIIGGFAYPQMFDVWLWSVPSIVWLFSGVLIVVVFGLVWRYGYNPTTNDESDGNSANASSKSVLLATTEASVELEHTSSSESGDEEETLTLIRLPTGSD